MCLKRGAFQMISIVQVNLSVFMTAQLQSIAHKCGDHLKHGRYFALEKVFHFVCEKFSFVIVTVTFVVR